MTVNLRACIAVPTTDSLWIHQQAQGVLGCNVAASPNGVPRMFPLRR